MTHPSSETVYADEVRRVILDLKSVNGFDGRVTLSCAGGPAGFVGVDLPRSVKLYGRARSVSRVGCQDHPGGKYTITFTGTSGSRRNSATVPSRSSSQACRTWLFVLAMPPMQF